MDYLIVKWLHILSSTFLFGTGIGSAFYMLFTSISRDVRAIAVVSRHVVLADWIFTATTVVIQPVTGIYMIYLAGFAWQSVWIMWSIALYFFAGACWLPVVWIQMRMRDMAQVAARDNTELPQQYWRFLRLWVGLGIPAFFALVIVFWLMVAKPV
jgi:uncharacterized membrane protein